LVYERNVKCYNEYFFSWYVFHTEQYDASKKTYNSGVCVKGSTSNKFEVDYYGKLQEVIELQYHRSEDTIFLFKCYWYDIVEELK